MKMRKIILIGVDGASWNQIMPLIDRGELPNFQYLIENGVHGILESIDPPYTPIVWTTISTGKNPEKHGVVSVAPSRYDLKTLRIWNIIEEYGGSIGLFYWPVTWPPRKTRHFMVPGSYAKSDEAFPSELNFISKIREFKSENMKYKRLGLEFFVLLEKAIKNGMTISTLKEIIAYLSKSRFRRKQIIEAYRQIVGQSLLTDLYVCLYRKYKPLFSAYYISAIDTAAHLTWKYYEPEKFGITNCEEVERYGQLILASYKNTDRCIGKVLRRCVDEKATLIVVSDHGTRAATEGETTFKIDAKKIFEKLGIETKIDYFYSEQGVYFSTKNGLLEEKVLQKLSEVKMRETKRKVFRISQSDIAGLYSIRCEDSNIEGNEWSEAIVELDGLNVKLSEIVQRENYRISGIHHKEGIFIAFGPDIKKGEETNMRVADVTPTILYYLGLPIAEDMDGKVKLTMFQEPFKSKNPIKNIRTYDSEERAKKYLIFRQKQPESGYKMLEERLKTLGYI
jgi:predicted AlkP superfamily phosphohydrolase/phosphomutase